MAAGYVLALDQGTTGSTAIVFDAAGQIAGRGYREIPQFYPQPGWVEHDPRDLWRQSLVAIAEAKANAGVSDADIAALGITNQRETTIVWDGRTGEPLHRAIVWQCRRSAPLCDALMAAGLAEDIRRRSGLVIDAYFSATKIQWLLREVSGLRSRAEAGELRFGTVDSWLIWNLTGGRVHATDYSNAGRTMLFNIHERRWDDELLRQLDVPSGLLPSVHPSSGVIAETSECRLDGEVVLGAGIPIAGVAGDQHAALFGQACFHPGMVKVTYGTGSFLLMHTGQQARESRRGLLTTFAWGRDDRVEYALEGGIFISGAAVQWLRDELGIIKTADETEALASSVADTGGVYFVPAFVGLGTPYWDMYARGLLIGLTRGTGRAQIARATLEAIAYQTRDVVDVMSVDAATTADEIRVDGGAAVNNFLCQFQADVLGLPVVRPKITETTALGAAYLAGLAVGVWPTQEVIADLWQVDRRFEPRLSASERDRLYAGWQRAVARSRDWASTERE